MRAPLAPDDIVATHAAAASSERDPLVVLEPLLAPSAHDVLREARLLRALEPTAARVPRVLAVCGDPALIGAPFYRLG